MLILTALVILAALITPVAAFIGLFLIELSKIWEPTDEPKTEKPEKTEE